MRLWFASVVITVIVVGSARASRADDSPDSKNPSVALGLSITGTVIGAAMMVPSGDKFSASSAIGAGFLTIGPSFGQWYSGRILTPGLGVRALGVIAAGAGFATDFFGCQDSSGSCPDHDKGVALIAIGGALVIGGAIWDIATAPSSAREWNRDHASLTVTAISSPSGVAPGLAVVGSF